MGLFELILLAVGLAMDAFAVSICKGLAAGKITKKEYLLCGVWFGGFQGLMPFIGYLVGSNFEKLISMIAPWLAFAILSFIGGNMIREALGDDEEAAPGFDVKTMFMMAVATSIDALAVGITFVAVPVEVLKAGPLINVIFAILSFFAGYGLMLLVFKAFVLQMDGYFAFYMSRQSMVLSVVYLLIGYAFVSLIDLFRIRRIPLDVALKNVE